MNLVIIVSLIGIALALFIGFAVGNRKGIQEGREEAYRMFTKLGFRESRSRNN
jgi:hypothetical protein